MGTLPATKSQVGPQEVKEAGVVERLATALLTGGLASAIGKTAVAPFERVRLLLQTQSLIKDHANPYSGTMDALRRLPREQGVASLWRGNLPNLLRIVPTYGLRFTFLGYFQSAAAWGAPAGQPLSLSRQMVAGAMSGFATVLVTYPLDLVRTRMSADVRATGSYPGGAAGSSRAAGITAALRTVVQRDGATGLYRGLFVSAAEITPYLAISLGGYEYFKARLPAEHDGASTKLVLAWGVGTVASLLCFPIDTVKRRIMLDGSPGFEHTSAAAAMAAAAAAAKKKTRVAEAVTEGGAVPPAVAASARRATVPKTARGTLAYVREMHAQGGVGIFYRGCLLNAAKSAPSVSITFVCNDLLRDLVRNS